MTYLKKVKEAVEDKMLLRDYIEKHWDILKPADDFSIEIHNLNICESLIMDLDKQDYSDLLLLIDKKRTNLLDMNI